jgi:hypothetical protein
MRAEGNLVGEVVNVGDVVTVNQQMPQQYRLNTNDRFDIEIGERLTVTRVMGEVLNVRTIETKSVQETRDYNRRNVQRQVSFQINRMFLMFEDPDYVPPPPPRKLGKLPTHEEARVDEDVELIGIDHPGLQWLFNDMGVYAEQQGYCSQYDALCVKLGIPGRPRDFTVRTIVKGIHLSTTVKARSQREANDLVKEALTSPESITIDPDFAPAA